MSDRVKIAVLVLVVSGLVSLQLWQLKKSDDILLAHDYNLSRVYPSEDREQLTLVNSRLFTKTILTAEQLEIQNTKGCGGCHEGY